jgi:hypothetical protein
MWATRVRHRSHGMVAHEVRSYRGMAFVGAHLVGDTGAASEPKSGRRQCLSRTKEQTRALQPNGLNSRSRNCTATRGSRMSVNRTP